MQSLRTDNMTFDKENIQSFHNHANPRVNNKRVFGKVLSNNENTQQPSLNVLSDKLVKQEVNSKPLLHLSVVNPQLVAPVQAHIFEYLKSRLSLYYVDKDYMDKQTDVNVRMRAILIDWMIDVNLKFKLLPQTLFMTVNIMDRYLSVKKVSRNELQLLGVCALMIVGKYEEIYPPVMKDYIAVCDGAYKREDLLRMEADIIATLQFNLTQPSSFYFLQLLQQKLVLEAKPLIFVQYILESALLSMESLKYDNLTLVAGAVFLVNKIFKRGRWTHDYTSACGVNEQEAKNCAKELYCLINQVEQMGLTAIKRKFSTPVYYEVSRFRVEKVSGSRNSN